MEKKKSVLVIGDVMLDVYVKGQAKRLSPEAPCPVLEECQKPVTTLGGAANVALQLSAADFEVHIWGCVGKDKEGKEIERLLKKFGIKSLLIKRETADTTVKTRYLTSENRQLLRVDRDCVYVTEEKDCDSLLEYLQKENYDAIVLSDYGKGVLSDNLCRMVIHESRKKGQHVVVDIKNEFSKFCGASIVKGNLKEFDSMFVQLGINDKGKDTSEKLRLVCESLHCKYAIMTAGCEGISGYSPEDGFMTCPAQNVPIFDVTGAGDVVTAFLTASLLKNVSSFAQMLGLANKAAQKKVSQVGSMPVAYTELTSKSKVSNPLSIAQRHKDKRIVFTNGCFDVLHAGHVSLLEKAKGLGDVLVVGINTDESVKRLKGKNRPINSLENRISVLSAINCVDYVIPFRQSTPLSLIKSVKPDILVKGSDYAESEVVGADYVKSYGGKVVLLPLCEGLSSTNILAKI